MSSEDPNAPKTARAVPLASLHASGVKGVELKKTAQRVEWCDWEEEHTQLDDLDEEPILTMILNSLMFCGLVITPDVLWTFPRQVIEYGGVYFIFIYFFMLFLIAFPLLHMEIFVGQRCQSGIIKTTRMYGYGFECLGIGIFCFTLIKSLPGVQDSYILIRHLINIFDDAEGIMSCEYDGYEAQALKYRVVLTQFFRKMRRIENPDFDFERLLYNILVYGLVAAFSIFGFKAVRILLIFVYCCFIVIFISMAYYFLSLGGGFSHVLHELYIFSTPESIFYLDTYVKALDLSLVTTGIGLSALLCASSFRPRRGDSFTLTYVIIISNVVVCFLSLVYALGMLKFAGFGSNTRRTPTVEGKRKFDNMTGHREEETKDVPRASVEYFKKNQWVNACGAVDALTNFMVYFEGPLIMVYAFVRDHVPSHHRMWNIVAIAGFSAVCFTLSVFRSLPTVNEMFGVLAGDLSYSVIYLIVAALVVIFVHLYGEREYLIDLCELYTLKEKENRFMSPTYSRQFVVFDAVPFAFLVSVL
uniref:SSD domain-containing protein n=1 Tax=Angiostrongylus cantonensis TaxID=6313 RepID=A0A158P6D8_ANGCA